MQLREQAWFPEEASKKHFRNNCGKELANIAGLVASRSGLTGGTSPGSGGGGGGEFERGGMMGYNPEDTPRGMTPSQAPPRSFSESPRGFVPVVPGGSAMQSAAQVEEQLSAARKAEALAQPPEGPWPAATRAAAAVAAAWTVKMPGFAGARPVARPPPRRE
jgi:hypothetical protein